MIHTLVLLIFGHVLGDFALQTERMARGKSRHTNDLERYVPWYYWLTAHAVIQGGIVGLVTGSVWLGVVETALHWIIDVFKCEGATDIHLDQLMHLLCMIIYACIVNG